MHQNPYGTGQGLAPFREGPAPVAGLFGFHGFENDTGVLILPRQAREMGGQMRFHLPFRFRQITETHPASETPGAQPAQEGTGIPERVQAAGVPAEFMEASRTPPEMPRLFSGGAEQGAGEVGIVRCGPRLSPVERLGGHLSGMVDPEQALALACVRRRPHTPVTRLRRDGCGRPECPERVVALGDQTVLELTPGFRTEPAHNPDFHKE